jgi:hypothetical protein
MEKTLTISPTDILKQYLEEGKDGEYSLTEYALQRVAQMAQNAVDSEISKQINIGELVKNDYGSKYVQQKTKEIIDAEMKVAVEGFVHDWMKRNLQSYVIKIVTDTVYKFAVPSIEKIVASLIVVNSQDIEQEMKAMQESLEAAAASAYEEGARNSR